MVGVKFKKEMLEWKAEEELRFWDVNLPSIYYLPDLYKIWHKYISIFFLILFIILYNVLIYLNQ